MNWMTVVAGALIMSAFYAMIEGIRKPTPVLRGAVMLLVMLLMLAAGAFLASGGAVPLAHAQATSASSAGASVAPHAATGTTGSSGAALPKAHGEAAFVAAFLPYARQASHDLGWPVSVIIAQAGVEHGWNWPDFDGYSFANSKAIIGQPQTDNGFAYAATPQIGLSQYEEVARLSYYISVAPAAAHSANAAAVALGQSPWDQAHYDNGSGPGSALLAVMQSYNLYTYDR